MDAIPSRVRNRNGAHPTQRCFREKSTAQKVHTAEHYHQFAAISRASKVLTSDATPTSDPGHVERLQQLFPPPSADYDSPIQMGADLPEHWPSEIEINELWNTQDAFERILKFHSIPALSDTSVRNPYFVPQTLTAGG